MALYKKVLSAILALLLAAGLALPAAAQRTINTPEEALVLPEASRLQGFLHRDTRQAVKIILGNTLSQFVTGDADTDEIDQLFASLPLLRESDELPGQERFRTLGMLLAKMMWPGIQGRTATLHTDAKLINGHTTITITHPFHPDKGKVYEYLGENAGRVRCLDEQGKTRIFPKKVTNLHVSGLSQGGSCVMSVDDLLALKDLMDTLLSCR